MEVEDEVMLSVSKQLTKRKAYRPSQSGHFGRREGHAPLNPHPEPARFKQRRSTAIAEQGLR